MELYIGNIQYLSEILEIQKLILLHNFMTEYFLY